MSEYFTILTKNGLNKVIKSVTDNTPIVLSKMAVSDDKSEINQDNTVLKSVKHKFSINAVTQDPNDSNVLICEGIINADVGGFYIRKIGVYTDDDMLFAIGKVPESYKPVLNEGSAKDITIKFMLQIDNSANITLKVDNNIVLATRSYVNSEISKLNKVYLGKEEKATDSDKLDGLDSTKFLKKEDKIDWENIQNKPNLNVSSLPVGTIISFIGGVEPENALYCDGRAVSRTQYVDLFTSIGVTYGAADGSTTFNIPDLRGLFLRGAGGNAAAVGSIQQDEIKKHKHRIPLNQNRSITVTNHFKDFQNSQIPLALSSDDILSDNAWAEEKNDFSAAGGVETRPVNTAVKYYIVYKGKTTGSTPNTQNPELFLKKSEMDMFLKSKFQEPSLAGSATFEKATNKITLNNIVSALNLEIGDVIKIENSVNNNKIFTIEEIEDDNNIVVNKEHSNGAGQLSLENETKNITVKRIAKYFNVPIGLGQAWVSVISKRNGNIVYENNTNRTIAISCTYQGRDAGVDVYINDIHHGSFRDVYDSTTVKTGALILIPPSSTYKYIFSAKNVNNIAIWSELR